MTENTQVRLTAVRLTEQPNYDWHKQSPLHTASSSSFQSRKQFLFLFGAEHNRRRSPTRSEDESTFPSKPIYQLLISHFTPAFSRNAAFVLRPDAAMPRHHAGLTGSPPVSHSPHRAPPSAAASSIWLWTCCPFYILSYLLTGTFCHLACKSHSARLIWSHCSVVYLHSHAWLKVHCVKLA